MKADKSNKAGKKTSFFRSFVVSLVLLFAGIFFSYLTFFTGPFDYLGEFIGMLILTIVLVGSGIFLLYALIKSKVILKSIKKEESMSNSDYGED